MSDYHWIKGGLAFTSGSIDVVHILISERYNYNGKRRAKNLAVLGVSMDVFGYRGSMDTHMSFAKAFQKMEALGVSENDIQEFCNMASSKGWGDVPELALRIGQKPLF